jgi:hypothetical protein
MAAALRYFRHPMPTSRHGITPPTGVTFGFTAGPAVRARAPQVFWQSVYGIPLTMASGHSHWSNQWLTPCSYGQLLEAVARGDYFISMGEVLLPKVEVSTASPATIMATLNVQWTFPFAFGEVFWSDGNKPSHRLSRLPRPGRSAAERLRGRSMLCQGLEVGARGGMGCRRERSIHQSGPPLALSRTFTAMVWPNIRTTKRPARPPRNPQP